MMLQVHKMSFKVAGKIIVLFLALLLFVVTVCWPSIAQAETQSSANAELGSAGKELVECYDAARAVEAAGANISALTIKLNVAGSLFSQAELAYSYGNFSGAYALASQSQNELGDFVTTAKYLQTSASQKQYTNFLLTFILPIIGAFAVIDVSIIVWMLTKRRYQPAGGS